MLKKDEGQTMGDPNYIAGQTDALMRGDGPSAESVAKMNPVRPGDAKKRQKKGG